MMAAELESQFSRVADKLPGFVFTFRRNRRGRYGLPFAGNGIGEIFGLPPGALPRTAAPLLALIPPDEQSRLLAAIEESANTMAPLHCETRVRHPARGERWIELRAIPEGAPDGALLWHGIVLDVSERKQAEATDTTRLHEAERQLKDLQARLHALTQAIPDLFWLKDPDGVYVACNRHFEKLIGTDEAAVVGMTDHDLFPAELADFFRQKDCEAMAAGGLQINEEWVTFADDGRRALLETRKAPVRSADGKLVGVLGIAREVTLARRMEEELRRRERDFRTLVENSPDAIVRYDRQCRRIYVSPAYERLSGIPMQEALGRTPVEFSYLPAEVALAHQKRLGEIIDSGVPAEIELSWERPDGGLATQQIRAVPEYGENGEIAGVLTIARDISATRNAERRLKDAEAIARLGHWEWDYRLRRATGSAEVCRIFGQPRDWAPSEEELIGLLVDDDRGRIMAALQQAYARRLPEISCDYRIRVGERISDIHSRLRITYTADGLPLRLLGTAQDVSELKAYQQQLYTMAFYDNVTGLPNRRLFNERLREAIDKAPAGARAGVMLLDLDNFKMVNDAFGHDAGDCLLREVAERLQRALRRSDTVARLGGDEFAILLPEVAADADLCDIGQQLLDAIRDPYQLEGREVFVQGSLGLARHPDDSANPADLLKFADAAMYHAKKMGRNHLQQYSRRLTADPAEQLGLLAGLRHALRNHELELYYQPQFELASGRLTGAEALLRWNHPELGLVPPDKFIGIAEDTGLIVGIGDWVLQTACAAASHWNRAAARPLRIAVNLSARQFKMNDLVDTVERALSAAGCSPDWLELEITERLLLDESVDARLTLQAFRTMGLGLAIDDFGTGYSALGYLKRFPVDTIKIDRSFVQDIPANQDSAALVKAIISMAHSLRLKVVAEGIEAHSQVAFLCAHGCHSGQGYFYGKPMPQAQFEAWMQAEMRSP